MSARFALAGVIVMIMPHCLLQAQGLPTGVVGWYNGDWKPLVPSWINFYVSDQQTSRVRNDIVHGVDPALNAILKLPLPGPM